MSEPRGPVRVTAIAASGELGGTERVLLDFAARAFEHDLVLRVLTPRHGPLVDILREIGVPAEVVPGPAAMLRGSQRSGHRRSIPLALAGLALWGRRLARHAFVRETDLLYPVGFKPYLATVRLAPPSVWHLHEFPPGGVGAVWKALSRRVPDALIANSEAVAAAWAGGTRQRRQARQTRQGARITVVRNGVDLDRFCPRPRTGWIHDHLGLAPEARLVGMPAVLARWKGQLEVLDAFSTVGAAFPDAHLVFVGGSIYDTVAEREYERALEAAVAHWRGARTARVHRLPFTPKIELVYPELEATVHYSLRPEPFGRVILESMACGVPVLAAAEGGPLEIVTEGGWLVPPRRPPALADALRQALQLPPEDLRRVGRWGRVRAEDHFSARAFARHVADVLRRAWDSSGRSASTGDY